MWIDNVEYTAVLPNDYERYDWDYDDDSDGFFSLSDDFYSTSDGDAKLNIISTIRSFKPAKQCAI
jgi:hypothetical protein